MLVYRFNNRHRLPRSPGIYVLEERGSLIGGWRPRYVGQSINVCQRWTAQGDREHKHLQKWFTNQRTMRLRVVPCWRPNLDYREAELIQRLKPDLNVMRPKPKYDPWVFLEDCWHGCPLAFALLILFLALSQ